jgi:hypothetical protein
VKQILSATLIAVGLLSTFSSPQAFQQAAAAPKVAVCSLLPKAEVKKHLPWEPFLDAMPITEEAIGANGSSCNYLSVDIQVLPFSQSMIDTMRKAGAKESISGLGDEAYFRNNNNLFAEVVVRVGSRLLTVQANADGKIDAIKPGALSLARALVARLR